jgi:hypothetical protein
MPTTEGIIST